MTDQESDQLVLVGREFEGFDRALAQQFRNLQGLRARHELLEIATLERMVLDGTATDRGDIDVLMVITDWLPRLIADRKLVPLDAFLEAEPPEGWPHSWVPSLRSLQTGPDGKTYGVPYHDGPVMLLYRRDLYEDASQQSEFRRRHGYPLAPATTWKEFLDQARWFNRPGSGMYGTVLAGYPDEHNNVYDFLTQLWSRGGDVTGGDGYAGLGTAQARDAYLFLRDLWHVDRVVDPAAAAWDSVASGHHFAAGEAALMVNWCGFASLATDPSSPAYGAVGCAPAPSVPGGRTVTMNSYWVLVVPRGCRRPERAYELLRQLVTPEMDRITAVSGGTATRRDTWRLPEVRQLAPYYEILEQAHKGARAVPRDPRWPAIASVLNDMMWSLVGSAAGIEALEDAQRRLGQILTTSAAG